MPVPVPVVPDSAEGIVAVNAVPVELSTGICKPASFGPSVPEATEIVTNAPGIRLLAAVTVRVVLEAESAVTVRFCTAPNEGTGRLLGR